MCRIQLQKKKSGVKKCLEIRAIKGGGGGGGRTPNGKNHLKFPFWLLEPLPKPFFRLKYVKSKRNDSSICMFIQTKSFWTIYNPLGSKIQFIEAKLQSTRVKNVEM